MCQNHLSNKFEKWISTSYICATYFELTNPVVQNSCDKNTSGGIMFYKHLLLIQSLRWHTLREHLDSSGVLCWILLLNSLKKSTYHHFLLFVMCTSFLYALLKKRNVLWEHMRWRAGRAFFRLMVNLNGFHCIIIKLCENICWQNISAKFNNQPEALKDVGVMALELAKNAQN